LIRVPARWGSVVTVLLALALLPAAAESAPDVATRGAYLFKIAGCASCHTDEKHRGPPLAGGRKIETPLGVFYSPNITPDPKFGIGRWSDDDFIRALRVGLSPTGAHYYPAFPYTSYTWMQDEDMRALKAYLFTLPPVPQANKPHALPWYLQFRPTLKIWKALYFTQGPFIPQADKSPVWNRGAYLTTAIAHCRECHTPRNILGGFKHGLDNAGTDNGPEDSVVPNITRDKKTGIGRWSQAELMDYLQSGATPDGDYAGGLMGEVIDNSLRHLQKEDLAAIAAYIVSLPPIEHAVRAKDKKPRAKKNEFE